MNISKVYYEELKSKCVNGKWESVRIGAEVKINDFDSRDLALESAKLYVEDKLGSIGYGNKSKDEVQKLIEQINKEVKEILAMI